MTVQEDFEDGVDAFRFVHEQELLVPLRAAYSRIHDELFSKGSLLDLFAGRKSIAQTLPVGNQTFHVRSFGKLPLVWISGNAVATHDLFEDFFAATDASNWIRDRLELSGQPMVYAGTFIVSEQIVVPYWHRDWDAGAKAVTLLCPLFEPASDHGGLLYLREGVVHKYVYQAGHGIVFGDRLEHTTAPFRSRSGPRILISITAGSREREDWPLVRNAVCGQSDYLRCPKLGWVPSDVARRWPESESIGT